MTTKQNKGTTQSYGKGLAPGYRGLGEIRSGMSSIPEENYNRIFRNKGAGDELPLDEHRVTERS